MKAILLSLFVALLMVGCGEETVDYDDLEDRNGVAYLADEETPFTGRAEKFYQNGQKEEEANFKDGKEDGPVTKWFENGQKWLEGNWEDGDLTGSTEWYENGQKRGEATFKDGEPDGLETHWYENGQKRREGKYKDGKLTSVVVWKPNGEKCPVTNVKDGTGVVVWYNEDGTERWRETYKDGEQVED